MLRREGVHEHAFRFVVKITVERVEVLAAKTNKSYIAFAILRAFAQVGTVSEKQRLALSPCRVESGACVPHSGE